MRHLFISASCGVEEVYWLVQAMIDNVYEGKCMIRQLVNKCAVEAARHGYGLELEVIIVILNKTEEGEKERMPRCRDARSRARAREIHMCI